MKLSKLYSNKTLIFQPIVFNKGLNVIVGEIQSPKDDKKDTHNLGKTTLVRLLDFVLLAKKNNQQFLFKNYERFKSFVFFLEIQLNNKNFLTIRRSVENSSKISFILHSEQHQDFTALVDEHWNHANISFKRAQNFLEGCLSFDTLTEWNYRKLIGLHIRTQEDFNDVFKLNKDKGADALWKPYISDLLGINGDLIKQNYQKQSDISSIENEIRLTPIHQKNASAELSDINGKILLRNNDLVNLENFINEFNFSMADQQTIEKLVGKLNNQISQANTTEYSIKNNIARIEESLKSDDIKFNTEKVKKLFEEANILFPEQVTKSFEQLIQFNKMITQERKSYLINELKELNEALVKIKQRLTELNIERSDKMSFLIESELVSKFKKSNAQIVNIKAEIEYLNLRRKKIEELQRKEAEKNILTQNLKEIQSEIQKNINEVSGNKNSILSKTLIYFNEIISEVLNKEGSITVYQNDSGNIDFKASYKDRDGDITSEGDGHSYKKFLCIAFDLAISRAYLEKDYIRFIYIDGVFEGLDVRKKRAMLKILKKYANLGLQIIITSIDTDLIDIIPDSNVFDSSEIILTLNDTGIDGRLFKMDSW